MSALPILRAGLVGSALALGGCRAAPEVAEALAATPEAAPAGARPDAQARPLATAPGAATGRSVEGRPIPYSVHGTGPETLLLLASIHGDEDAGTPLLERLATELEENPVWTAGARVVIVPVVNPDGLAAHRRHNARGVDLNRNFPAANRRERRSSGPAPLSEPESAVLLALIEGYAPRRVVSIHGWVGVVDWDGPAQDLARAVGRACGLPAQRIGSRPGSLGSWVGVDREIPILTLELPASARHQESGELWERYGDALLTFIRWTAPHSS